MENLRRALRQGLTGFQLKCIALAAMVTDHLGEVFFAPDFLRAIGRAAFPLYAFLAAEGCRRTGSRKRYLLGLGLFALVSEVPFDLAFEGILVGDTLPAIRFLSRTNVFYTLFLAVACVQIYDALLRQPPRRIRLLGGALGGLGIALEGLLLACISSRVLPTVLFLGGYTLCALVICARLPAPEDGTPETGGGSRILAAVPLLPVLFLAEACGCDYGAFGVGLVVLAYAAGTPRRASVCVGGAALVYYGLVHSRGYGFHPWYLVFTFAAAVLAWFYNGQRGRNVKWAFYWAYPAHIAALAVLRLTLFYPAA